jgi:ethanolamine utilization protein EutN
VATKKNPKMTGSKLLLVRPVSVSAATDQELKSGSGTLIATDALGAGEGDVVLIVQGSSARLAVDDKDSPVDAVVIGIVDTVDVQRRELYKAK